VRGVTDRTVAVRPVNISPVICCGGTPESGESYEQTISYRQ